MKKFFLTIIVFFSTFLSANAAHWMTSFEDAQKLAIATNKLILIDFWATWCRPCLKMDADTWNQPEVKKLMNNFVPLKIDIDSERRMAQKYSANRIPYVIIIDPNGEIIYDEVGYKDKVKIMRVLKRYSVNTSALQKDFLSFIKKNNTDDAIKIAEKYFDYSIYVDKAARFSFLRMANNYLKKAKKLSKKKDYRTNFSQRVKLLDKAYKKLIVGKYEKVILFLNEEFKEEQILAKNKGLYNFLYYTAYNKLKDRDNAKKWYEKLKTDKNVKMYLLKSRKL